MALPGGHLYKPEVHFSTGPAEGVCGDHLLVVNANIWGILSKG